MLLAKHVNVDCNEVTHAKGFPTITSHLQKPRFVNPVPYKASGDLVNYLGQSSCALIDCQYILTAEHDQDHFDPKQHSG